MRTTYSRLRLAWCSVGGCSGDLPHKCCFYFHPVWNKCAAWILGKPVLPALPGFEIDMPARISFIQTSTDRSPTCQTIALKYEHG